MKTIFLVLLFISTLYSQNIIRVPQDYGNIQTALDSSNNYDTIIISQGTYKENLKITKPITIIGDTSNSTFIITDSLLQASIYVNASNVLLRNLHIKKEPSNEGIMIENSENCKIENCVIDSNLSISSFGPETYFYGIYIISSNNVVVTNCVVKDNRGGSFYGSFGVVEGDDGIGIRIDSSSNVEVKNSFFYGNKRGLSSQWPYGNGIGIKVVESDSNIYIRNCSIYKNNIGILFYYFNSFAYVGGSPAYSNNIYDNSDYNIRNDAYHTYTINATYNYFGTNNFDSIKAKIWGDVDFSDYITNIFSSEPKIPNTPVLAQNYPNPFNPTTTINYSIPKTSFVTIKVYDALGRELETLVNEEKLNGNYKIEFNGSKFTSGIYFYRMQAGNFVDTKKLILLK